MDRAASDLKQVHTPDVQNVLFFNVFVFSASLRPMWKMDQVHPEQEANICRFWQTCSASQLNYFIYLCIFKSEDFLKTAGGQMFVHLRRGASGAVTPLRGASGD